MMVKDVHNVHTIEESDRREAVIHILKKEQGMEAGMSCGGESPSQKPTNPCHAFSMLI